MAMSNLLSVMAARAQQLAGSRAAAWGRRAVAVAPGPALGLALLALAAYAGYFTYYALLGLDLVGLLRDVNNDDAFYYYQIARNLAEGQFSTFDGGITRTNGYHPVWMLLITPFYWVLDRETALFGIKALELGLIGGSAVSLVVSARLCRLPWLALFAVLPLLYQRREIWFGLEAAAGLLALSLLFLSLSLMARQPGRWWPLLAAAAFIQPWVRLEYLAISLAATAGAAVVVGMQPKPDADAGAARRRHPGLELGRFRIGVPPWRVVGPLLGACGGGVIYFAYNRLVFGGYVPVSGAFKALWSQTKFAEDGGYSLMQNVAAHWQHDVFRDGLLAAVEVGVYALLVWWVGRRAFQPRPQLLPIFLVGAAALAMGHAAKFVQHGLAIHPFYNEGWYFVPAYLLTALLIPIRCFTAVYLIKALVSPRWPNGGRLLSAGTVGAAVIALAVTVDFGEPFRFIDDIQDRQGKDWEISSYLGTQAMNGILPDDAVVGSEHAGVIGYFADVPVVNLDGLVNTYDFYYYCRDTSCDLLPYIREYGVTHLAGIHPVTQWAGDTLFEGAALVVPPPIGSAEVADNGWRYEFKLWRAPDNAGDGAAPAARLWVMLQERADYYADDAAALVSSNLVHTFYRDCDPERDEPLALVVTPDFAADADGSDDNSLWYFGSDLRRNNLGYCDAVFELPGDTAHPVSVVLKPFGAAVDDFLRSNRPVIESDWQVHRVARGLLYYRAPCAPADTAAQFSLEIIPSDAGGRPAPDWYRRDGADYQSFDFGPAGGVMYAGRCLVIIPLPDYEIDAIRTGQYILDESVLWNDWYYTETYIAGRAAAYAERATGEPEAAGFFSVYQGDGELIYVRADCAPADTAAMFYLHLVPAEAGALPEGQREHGFDNRDFEFDDAGGVRHAGRCLVSVPLPDYEIHGIRTGQFVPGAGQRWGGEFYTDAYFAAPASELAARDYYRVYHGDGALTYLRDGCEPVDTAAAFYLHLIPSDVAALPEGQRANGFDNRDFEFGVAGGVEYDGRCLVSVPLPDYAIDRIRTGQYTPGAGRLWAVEFAVEQGRGE